MGGWVQKPAAGSMLMEARRWNSYQRTVLVDPNGPSNRISQNGSGDRFVTGRYGARAISIFPEARSQWQHGGIILPLRPVPDRR